MKWWVRRGGDALLLVGGAWLGWQLDITTAVDGSSMLPTLQPGDRVLHVPRWLAPADLTGRVVVARVAADGSSVCKRVARSTRDAAVAKAWEAEAFTPVEVHRSLFEAAADRGEAADADGAPAPAATVDELRAMTAEAAYYESMRLPLRATDWDAARGDGERLAAGGEWLWLEGDNASDSFDSRSAGVVNASCVRGVVIWKLWRGFHAL